jgi:hypothetical protein
MDFFGHKLLPKPLLSSLLPYSRTFNCTSKTTGWFTKKGLKLIQPAPLNKVCTQGSTRILIYIDGLLSVISNCAQTVAFFHIPVSGISLGSKTDWTGAEIDLTCPHN